MGIRLEARVNDLLTGVRNYNVKRSFALLCACLALAACGDPLRNVDRLSSVELAEDTPVAQVRSDPAEAAPRGLFSGLFGSKPAAAPEPAMAETDAAVAVALEQAAPLVQTAETEAEAPAPRRGLFGFLRKSDTPEAAGVQTASLESSAAAAASVPMEAALAAPEPQKLAEVTESAPAAEARPRRGLFGLLSGARAADKAQDIGDGAQVRTASLGPVENTAPEPLTRARAGRDRAHKGPDTAIVPFGTKLPSGAIARVCDLPSSRFGKEVGKFPERGRGYKIFDSNPRASGPRPFYVTGFKDNCARTFTAALALFGSPTMHEQLRYGLPSKTLPYSTTDKAYEGIKRSVCGVGKQKPCGAKIAQLEKDTAFISIYDRIGSNSSWSNVLLHKGWVLAADKKS